MFGYHPPTPPSPTNPYDFSKAIDIDVDVNFDFDGTVDLKVNKDINVDTTGIKLNDGENVAIVLVGIEAFGPTTFAELILDVTTTDTSSQIYADGMAISS